MLVPLVLQHVRLALVAMALSYKMHHRFVGIDAPLSVNEALVDKLNSVAKLTRCRQAWAVSLEAC